MRSGKDCKKGEDMSCAEERKYFPKLAKKYCSGQEQIFKRDVTRYWKDCGFDCIWLENSETASGAPDTIVFMRSHVFLFEFKVSDKGGYVRFQKTQPLYYQQHKNLRIKIIAFDIPSNKVVIRDANEVVEYIKTYNTLNVPLSSIQTKCQLSSVKWRERNRERVRNANMTHHQLIEYKKKAAEKRREERVLCPEKMSARNKMRTALANGTMCRPDICARCKRTCRPDGHHTDYSRPYDVIWLCKKCHSLVHNGANIIV